MFRTKTIRCSLELIFVALTFASLGQFASGATLTLDKSEYSVGEAIVATFADGPGNKKDWIGLYSQGTSPGSGASQAWLYVDGKCTGRRAKTSGSVTFDSAESCFQTWPLPAGNYKAYFCENDGYNILAGPVSFTVTSTGGPTFTLDKTTFYEGETITATFTGAPGNPTDWMGIYTTPNGGAPTNCSSNGPSMSWNYTDGQVDGSVAIYTPMALAGNYVAHLLANDAYCDIADPVNFTITASPNGSLSGAGGGKKVIFIGMDGVRPDALALADTPNIDYLIATGAYDGDATTNSATFSGPGWADITTGVTVNKHGVNSNSYDPSFNLKDWPSWQDILEIEDPSINTVSVTSWDLFHAMISYNIDRRVMHNGYEVGWDTADLRIKNDAKNILSNNDPDAMFVYFENTDGVGHTYGTLAQETLDEISLIDGYIGELITAIESRATFGTEDWLILVGTDHGRTDAGSHGGNSPDEKWTFYLASGTGSDQGTSVSGASSVTHAASALKHMLGAVDPGWGLDGQPKGLCATGCGGGCTATDMHIESVVCAEVNCGAGKRNGQSTVTIYDDCGNPVQNAIVDGTFAGDFSETINGVATDTNGQAVFTTTGCIKKPSFSFTVDAVTHATLPHDSNDDLTTGCSG
ncbi:MAG: alkaline phosphatase family protein [Planctomycetota bacterium]|jgi:hypothetical protein